MDYQMTLTGFLLSLSLIMGIGAQNIFCIRSSLQGRGTIAAAVCCICDTLLLTFGVFGAAWMTTVIPESRFYLKVGATVFLLWYAYKMLQGNSQQNLTASEVRLPIRTTIVAALGFSLLNPHAILDTVVIIGGIAQDFDGHQRQQFYYGTVFASFVWFFSLSTLVSRLKGFFQSANVWRWLNRICAALMVTLATFIWL